MSDDDGHVRDGGYGAKGVANVVMAGASDRVGADAGSGCGDDDDDKRGCMYECKSEREC